MSIPDMYDQWLAHERQQERLLARLPKCDRCREPIQGEHLFDIYGDIYCEECGIKMFRREVILDE
jgi:DNA-directed RNA polymerase subunit RPC12/RpoP